VTAPLSRTRWGLLGGLAALLYAVALLVTPHALPIYDGIGFPDEPYRFVDPPAGYRDTKPPTVATLSAPAANGRASRALTVNSGESGPQVSLYLPAGALETPDAASSVRVEAAPVALTGSAPPGHVYGNVYRISFTTTSGPARQAAGSRPELKLRSPSLQSGPTFYVRHGSGGWRALTTSQVGRDIYQTYLAGAGDYVLAGDDPLDMNAKDPNSEAAVGWVGFAVSGVLLAVILVVFVRAERRRSRRRAATKVSGNSLRTTTETGET
jgi:hypothetical protein